MYIPLLVGLLAPKEETSKFLVLEMVNHRGCHGFIKALLRDVPVVNHLLLNP